jgi:hypothetical protein
MKITRRVVVGGLAALPFASRLAKAQSADFVAAEILGQPTDTSVTVNVVPSRTMEAFYEYGTVPGSYTAQTAPQTAVANKPLETILSGLKPNTRYYYRLRYGNAAGQERSFHTQRPVGTPFTFTIQGDSHPERIRRQYDPDLYAKTLRSVASAQPDFHMTIGDDFGVTNMRNPSAAAVRDLYINQRQFLGLVGVPVFLANGNHEQASRVNLDGTPNNIAVWAQTARNSLFPQPAPDRFYTGNLEQVEHIGLLRDYYAWTWGDALFVVMDQYWHSPVAVDSGFGEERTQGQGRRRDMWGITLGEAQYQWLKRTLETSSAKYKFVFAHHVNSTGRGGIELAKTFEWGDVAGFRTQRPGWEMPIHQLMVKHGVNIFFQGHDHIFVQQELDGVIYQSLPQPANPNYNLDENAEAYKTGTKLPNTGYLKVSVAPTGVKVEYVRSYLEKSDELAFSYIVQSKPA